MVGFDAIQIQRPVAAAEDVQLASVGDRPPFTRGVCMPVLVDQVLVAGSYMSTRRMGVPEPFSPPTT